MEYCNSFLSFLRDTLVQSLQRIQAVAARVAIAYLIMSLPFAVICTGLKFKDWSLVFNPKIIMVSRYRTRSLHYISSKVAKRCGLLTASRSYCFSLWIYLQRIQFESFISQNNKVILTSLNFLCHRFCDNFSNVIIYITWTQLIVGFSFRWTENLNVIAVNEICDNNIFKFKQLIISKSKFFDLVLKLEQDNINNVIR